MTADPLPGVPPAGVRCAECGRVLAGVAWLVDHYLHRHPIGGR